MSYLMVSSRPVQAWQVAQGQEEQLEDAQDEGLEQVVAKEEVEQGLR